MNDMQHFIELYKSFGIELTAAAATEYWKQHYPAAAFSITLDEETHTSLSVGYGGFYSVITFDKDGKFINQGFWE